MQSMYTLQQRLIIQSKQLLPDGFTLSSLIDFLNSWFSICSQIHNFWATNMFFTSKWDRIWPGNQWNMFWRSMDDKKSHMTTFSVRFCLSCDSPTCWPTVHWPDKSNLIRHWQRQCKEWQHQQGECQQWWHSGWQRDEEENDDINNENNDMKQKLFIFIPSAIYGNIATIQGVPYKQGLMNAAPCGGFYQEPIQFTSVSKT